MAPEVLIPSQLPSIHRYFASSEHLPISDIHGDRAEVAIVGEVPRGKGPSMVYSGRAFGYALDNYWADFLRRLIVYRAEHGDTIQVAEVAGLFDGSLRLNEGRYGLEVVPA